MENNPQEREQMNEFRQYKYQSEHDELTGLYNRKKFYEKTRELLDSIGEELYAFIRFDIDRFKMINTFFGMERGDELLKYIARLLEYLPVKYPKCTYGRIQGDIFCLCVPYNEKSLQRMLNIFERVLSDYDKNYDIVPSVGVYIIKDPSQTVEAIYNKATMAAMRCKGSYVQHMSYYDHKIRQQMVLEQEVTNHMNTALQEGQFRLYFQPQYSLAKKKMIGAEALVRWVHPVKGLISPAYFIPLFEKNGFITKLDQFVWEESCRFIRRQLDAGREFGYLSVNVSRVDIYSPQFFKNICGLVEKYNIPPRLLHLELTESAYTDNPVMIRRIIRKLQEYGFLVMMDDFGSGYSSLNMLKDVNVDILKIDMMFLKDSDIKGRNKNILTSIIRMARWLQTPVIVEGVETAEQESFLRSIGCEYAQGYLYAKPLPEAEYENLLQNGMETAPVQENNVEKQDFVSIDEFWSASSRFADLFDMVIGAVAIYELHGSRIEMIRANDGFYRVTQEEPEAFAEIAKDILSVVYEKDRSYVLESFRSAIGQEQAVRFEYRRYVRNGAVVWMRINVRHILNSGGRNLFYGVFSDVTQEKETEERIRWENEKLRLVLENTDLQFWEFDIARHAINRPDADGVWSVFGDKAENVPESLIESGFVTAQSAEECRRIYREISEGAERAEADICYHTDMDVDVWYHVTLRTGYNSIGKPERAVGCARYLREDDHGSHREQ